MHRAAEGQKKRVLAGEVRRRRTVYLILPCVIHLWASLLRMIHKRILAIFLVTRRVFQPCYFKNNIVNVDGNRHNNWETRILQSIGMTMVLSSRLKGYGPG